MALASTSSSQVRFRLCICFCFALFSFVCVAWRQVMSAEWSKYDINCNTVGPTIVLTDMGAKAWG